MSRVLSRSLRHVPSTPAASPLDPRPEASDTMTDRARGSVQHPGHHVDCTATATHVDPSLIALLHAGATWEAHVKAALEAVGLSWTAYAILHSLAAAHQPLPLTELAHHAAGVPSRLTEVVDRLEADGLVAWVNDQHDRRVIPVQLTVLGRKRESAGANAVDAVSAEFGAAMPAADRDVLRRIVSRFA
jgi:DNA-binding MarR family transcriptional regulator